MWTDEKPNFIGSFNKLEQLPVAKLPEVAFVGRSNVGKSSLINALTQTKGLAKTSSTPGRTQSLNFFNWADKLMVVDLPGYGYAKAPKKLVENWQGVMKDYLRGRTSLKRVFLLIDSRHGVKKVDLEIMKMLDECAITYQIILTKIDKIGPMNLDKEIKKIEKMMIEHPALFPALMTTSSEKGTNLKEFRDSLFEII
ncbi:MAG: YihA family ribosome biogenesis GTP-binding protein [Alphaproteobacteria bacterium]|nr:YihA family ribosome biogenesis GTP-binding protein [Alphaproteobacteria bacterium]MBN2780107.1 YihA family ribosome biogenesis GTP-binding protein [Alphaproteobacteria bacterium]